MDEEQTQEETQQEETPQVEEEGKPTDSEGGVSPEDSAE